MDETGHRHIFVLQPGGVGRGFVFHHGGILPLKLHLPVIVVLVKLQSFFFGFLPGIFLGFPGIVLLLRLHGEFLGLDFLFGHGHLAVEAYAVAVGEKQMLVVVAVPVLRKHRRYLALAVVVVETLGMGDEVVIGNTAVLSLFLMVGREEQVGLVTVAEVGAPGGVVEEGGTVVGIIAAPVKVVEFQSQTQALAGIHGKEGLEVVLTVGAVAAGVQAEVGDR